MEEQEEKDPNQMELIKVESSQAEVQPEAQAITVTTIEPPAVRGLYRDLPQLMDGFIRAMESANMLAPIVRPDFIMPMHAVSLRLVQIDPRDKRGDVYMPQGADSGERALTKTALDKISAAAGISWDYNQCRRTDDGRDPHYCAYFAAGTIQDIDGNRRQIIAHKAMDLRDDSAAVARMVDAANARRKKDEPVVTPANCRELRMAREHILAHAESKAFNRAIRRALGIKQKYSAEELGKPFVVPYLVFTGETDNPILQAEIAKQIVARALGAQSSLYGTGPAPVQAAIPMQTPKIEAEED